MDNNINNNFNKNITAMAFNTLTLTTAPTTTSSNFFYNDYSAKHFMILNRPILIETAKNIVMSMNNNAFAHGLTRTEPGGTERSTARRVDVGNGSSNDKGKSATYFHDDNNNNNPPDLIVDINFLNYYFNDNG